jgi:isopenicillin N synthase-like dioxygenase
MTEELPVIDLSPVTNGTASGDRIVADALGPALREWGAFILTGHGVPPAALSAAFAATQKFFARPLEERMAIKVGKNNRGYVPMHQTVYAGHLPDLKESFNVGLGLSPDDPDIAAGKPLHGVNVWPDLPGFRADVEAYFNAMLALGDRMLGPLALCLDMHPDELRARYLKPIAFMRLFHYPPESRVAEGEHGAAEHQDYGFLTVLAQDAIGGFEVRTPGGNLVEVAPQPGVFLVNAGDMLTRITHGAIRSAPHRVINRAGVSRHSIPFFYDPDFDARFPGMPEMNSGEFLLSKFNQFYAYRKNLAS